MTVAITPGSVLLDPADAAVAAWAIRDAIRGLRLAGRPVPGRLVALAGTLTAAAGDSASPARPDRPRPAASAADLTVNVEVVPVSEVAALLCLSRSRVRQLIAAGELPARRAGKRVFLVDRAAAAALATARAASLEGA